VVEQWEVVVEAESGVAVQGGGQGRHHLAQWWISGGDGDEVRVMTLGC
jgi:hypothetical protein